eukprot:NODE_31_length_32452_cov_0.352672.p27 type:complete len:104 gc:universal NODE_31_length_32452_cov_0.352672:24150-23839(-)
MRTGPHTKSFVYTLHYTYLDKYGKGNRNQSRDFFNWIKTMDIHFFRKNLMPRLPYLKPVVLALLLRNDIQTADDCISQALNMGITDVFQETSLNLGLFRQNYY